MSRSYKAMLLLLATILFLPACSAPSSEHADGNRLKIVVTIYPLAELTRQIAGDQADVITMIPAGIEPHDWEPSPKDMELAGTANLFIYNGYGMEPFAEQMLQNVDLKSTQIVEAGKAVTSLLKSQEGEDLNGSTDPHFWLSPVKAKQLAGAIHQAITINDKQHQAIYDRNFTALNVKLDALDVTFKDAVKTAKRREFVTQHAAFAYLAAEYGLVQVSLSGLSPDQEPSAGALASASELIRSKNIKTIFFETLVSPKVTETIAAETGAKTAVLNPVEGLTAEDQQQGHDYFSLMKANADALHLALTE